MSNYETLIKIIPGLKEYVESQVKKSEETDAKKISPDGKCMVLGVDRFDDEDWVAGEFDSPQEAVKFAETKTKEAMLNASDESIATVYYAYTPDGKYLENNNSWDNKNGRRVDLE